MTARKKKAKEQPEQPEVTVHDRDPLGDLVARTQKKMDRLVEKAEGMAGESD